MFGGLFDFSVLDSIEKYDILSDTWISLHFKLPAPLAKHGCTLIEKGQIMICGGCSSDFEPLRETYILNMQSIKWQIKTPMKVPHLSSQGLFYSSGYVYAIGGNNKGICERYLLSDNKWQIIPSFVDSIENNLLFSFTMTKSI